MIEMGFAPVMFYGSLMVAVLFVLLIIGAYLETREKKSKKNSTNAD